MTPIPNQEKGMRVLEEPAPISSARLIAELQAVTIGIHLVGLNRLPEVMKPSATPTQHGAAA